MLDTRNAAVGLTAANHISHTNQNFSGKSSFISNYTTNEAKSKVVSDKIKGKISSNALAMMNFNLIPTFPTQFKQQMEGVPQELLNQPRWIKVGEDKIPLRGEWNNPENQDYVFDIQSPLKGFDISGHNRHPDYLVLDFDHVLNNKGDWINDYAKNVFTWIMLSAPTYVERSVSKTGFHVIYKPTKGKFGTINSNGNNNLYFVEGNKDSKIEFFYKTAGRQFIFTGDCEGLCEKQTAIASGEKVDNFLQQLIEEVHYIHNYQNTTITSVTQPNSFELNTQNVMVWVEDVLNLIDVERIGRSDWVNTGTSLKQLGMSFEVFNNWSSKDTGLTSDGKKNRYDERDCKYQWDSFNESGDVDAAVGQLINLAKEHDPQGFKEIWCKVETFELNRRKSAVMQVLDESNKPYKRRDNLMKKQWDNYVTFNKELNQRKTGFNFIDIHGLQDFKPGCYLIGAIPSAGKTTFCYQFGEQLAEHGTPVLFISCEMNEEALLLKSVTRKSKLNNDLISLNNKDIRNGGTSKTVENTVSDLKDDETPFYTYYAKHSVEIEKLVQVMNSFCADFKDSVVIIDYLQYLQTEKNFINDKQKIDYISRVIKDFVEDNPSVIAIIISSFNRAAYRSDVSMESFKETGGIEYFADVIWGLQYDVFSGKESNTDKKGVSNLELIEAKRDNPRKMMIRCIKNRFGKDYCVHFKYYPEYELFVETDEEDQSQVRKINKGRKSHETK